MIQKILVGAKWYDKIQILIVLSLYVANEMVSRLASCPNLRIW